MPEVRYLKLPPLDLHNQSLDLFFPVITYAEKGKKILIVADSISKEDIDSKHFFSGQVGNIISNAFDQAIKYHGKPPKEVMAVTTKCTARSDDKPSHPQDLTAIVEQYKKLIQKYQPDIVILLGTFDLSEWMQVVKFAERKYTKEDVLQMRGRLLPCIIDNHSCQLLVTFSAHHVASMQPKDFSSTVQLLGFTTRHFETALYGKNRYTFPKSYPGACYHIDTINKFDKIMKDLWKAEIVSIDTESDNLNRISNNRLLVILFTMDGINTYMITYQHQDTPFLPSELEYIRKQLKNYFEFSKAKFHIYHNAKFDVTQFFTHLKLDYYQAPLWDTIAGEYCLDENAKSLKNVGISAYALEGVTARYGALGYKQGRIKKEDRVRMSLYTPQQILEYGQKDVVYPFWIAKFQLDEAKRRGSAYAKYENTVTELSSDTLKVFVAMEQAGGVLVDKKYIISLMAPNSELNVKLRKLHEKFKESEAVKKVNDKILKQKGVAVGTRGIFNQPVNLWLFKINDQKHQQDLFFNTLNLLPLSRRKDGGGKIDKAFIGEYSEKVPEVAILAELREVEKLINTYVKGVFKKLARVPDSIFDGRLRSSYSFFNILTFRSGSRDPNLQNLPQHGKLAKAIKRMFIAACGYILVDADYRAHEVNCWGNVSHDENISKSFRPGIIIRRKIRILRADPELDYLAKEWMKKNNWFSEDIDNNSREKMLKKLSNQPKLKKLLQLYIDLSVFGDVHKLNAQLFFGTPADQVTKKERQSVKAVVFGVMYDKAKRALAADVSKKEVSEIIRNYAAKMFNAAKDYDATYIKILNNKMNKELEPYWNDAQKLINKLFEKFNSGGKWIKKTKEHAAENLNVVSPLGPVRHLWGFLHTDNSVQAMMARRAPNSIVQGLASNLGFLAAKQILKIIWEVKQAGVLLKYRHGNFVHDSIKTEIGIADLPINIYFMEHALTSQTHRQARKVYDFKMDTTLECEFDIGPAGSEMKAFDFTESSLMENVERSIDWMTTELNYDLDKRFLLKAVKHNWRIVNKYRVEELEMYGDDCKAFENMLIKPEMVKNLGLMGIEHKEFQNATI